MDNNKDVYNGEILNPEEYKKEAIRLALEELQNKGILKDEETKKALEEYYESKKDKKNRNIQEIFYEIKNLTPDEINKKINTIKNKDQESQKEEKKISIENIDEFDNQMKTKRLIKIHYPYPDDGVKIIENLSGKSAEELFNAAKDEKGLVSVDGFVDSCDVSKNFIEPDKIEVKLHNVTDLCKRGEFTKLTNKEKECVIGLISSIIKQLAKTEEEKEYLRKQPVEQVILKLNKNVFISPDENIVVLCTPNDPTKDEISAVKKNEKGEYELEDLKMSDNVKESNGFDEEEKEINQEKIEEKGVSMRKKAPWEKKRAA